MSKIAMQQIYKMTLILTTLLSLSGCSGYGSSFTCRDASGLNCQPLSVVDQRISSGEIVEVELKEQAKCKGRNCYAKGIAEKPDIKPSKIHKVKLEQETEQREFKDGNSLYIK